MAGKALSTDNCRERRWRPANSLPHRMASSLSEPPAKKFPNSSNNLQKSDLTSASHFPRSKLLYTPEEYSHWLSLMARAFSLGPSDAPWPVETSTAHGESSSWEPNLSMGKVNLYGDTGSISSNDHSRILSNQSSSEMDSSQETPPPVSIRRRFLHQVWTTKPFLGFWLEGWTHKIGPITSLKPKSIRHEPTQNAKNPRSGPIAPLLSLNQCLCRFLCLSGRRHQKSKKPLSLFWLCNTSLRILVLASSMADLKYLTITNTSMARTMVVQRIRNYTLKPLETDCIQQPQLGIVSSLFLLQPSRTMVNYSRKNFGLLFRTPLLPVTEKNRTRSSSASQCIMPAIREAKYPSSTSQDLLIVTISKIPEPFVEVSSTHRVLACGMLLVNLCFRVYMNLSLKFTAYPIFLMYVWKTLLQNFVSVASPLG